MHVVDSEKQKKRRGVCERVKRFVEQCTSGCGRDVAPTSHIITHMMTSTDCLVDVIPDCKSCDMENT
jgi:hypothetical protein